MSQSTDNSKQKVSVHLLLALTGLEFSSKATWYTKGAQTMAQMCNYIIINYPLLYNLKVYIIHYHIHRICANSRQHFR